MRELRKCLSDCSVPRLRALASARGIDLTTNRHVEAARFLAEAMLRPDSIAEALEILNPQERRALEAVQTAGGSVRADPFTRQFGGIRAIGDGRLMVDQPWLAPATPAERLWYLGLLFKAFAEYGTERVAYLFIPSDLLPLLPRPQAQAGLRLEPAGEPARSWTAGDAASLDICTLLAQLQNHQPQIARGRGLDPQDERAWRKRWAAALIDPPPFAGYADLRARFLLRIAGRLRLARRTGDRLKPAAEAARTWLNAPRSGRLGQMWAAWVNDPGWDELRRIPEIHCEGTGWRNDPILTRQRLLELLAVCEPGVWHSLPKAIHTIRERAPDFQRTGGDYNSWYIRDVKTGEYLMGFEQWDAIEGRLITQAVTGPMHWLGGVSLGQPEGGDLGFSVTAWGWAWLHGQEPEDAGNFAPVSVTEGALVHWPADGNLYHRFQMERFADWKGDADGSDYQITPASLARVLAQGVKADAIIKFLQRASEGQVPAEILGQVSEWAGRRGRARLSRKMLLETDSPATLAAIRSDPELSPRLGESLSPTCALVPESDWRDVLALLRKKGFVA